MPRSWFVIALVAAGCDCGGTHFRGLEQLPKVTVDPPAIRHDDLCAAASDAVLVRNDGQGVLHVTAVSVDGPGWTLSPPALPASLAPGEALSLALAATDGVATLHVMTDDPNHPDTTVALEAHANTPPVITFASPATDAVVDEASDLVATARLADDGDAPAALELQWTATTTGELSHLKAAADGTATVHWNAAGRPHGAQTLTLTAKDHCGAQTTATLPLCLDGAYSYQPFHLEGWHYEGATAFDVPGDNLRLTPAETGLAGSAFETSQVVGGENVEITFSFFIGNGTGADGFSLTALDEARMKTFLGPAGCGIGYGGGSPCTSGDGLPGWSVEVDTYYNAEVDPTRDDHVAFSFDGALVHQPLWAPLPPIKDSRWHTMRVSVHAPHVQVAIDGTTYLDGDVAGDLRFPAYVGFTAATGGETDEHRIRALEVSGRYCGG